MTQCQGFMSLCEFRFVNIVPTRMGSHSSRLARSFNCATRSSGRFRRHHRAGQDRRFQGSPKIADEPGLLFTGLPERHHRSEVPLLQALTDCLPGRRSRQSTAVLWMRESSMRGNGFIASVSSGSATPARFSLADIADYCCGGVPGWSYPATPLRWQDANGEGESTFLP